MCGIFGYIGTRDKKEAIIHGLHRLEHRGYDAAGIGVVLPDQTGHTSLISRVVIGSVDELDQTILQEPWENVSVAIGHVRWPTHGKNTIPNAHPHFDCERTVMLVHNGVIENFRALNHMLASHRLTSETDTELIAHLIEEELRTDSDASVAIPRAIEKLRGTYAIAFCLASDPDAIYVARMGSPVVIGVGEGELFIASEPYAFSCFTNRVIVIEDGMILRVTKTSVKPIQGNQVPDILEVDIPEQRIDLARFAHHMRREIDQQPEVIRQIIAGRFSPDRSRLINLPSENLLHQATSTVILGCGTAYHAGLIGKTYFEIATSVPTLVVQASEFEIGPSCRPYCSNFIAISQSGETWDTRQAINRAKKKGATATIAIVNSVGSSLERDVEETIHMRAGIEIGVAATKTFTAQCMTLFLFALDIGQRTGTIIDIETWFERIEAIPDLIRRCIDTVDPAMKIIADECAKRFPHTMFIGRGMQLPVAMEGALKLQEIAYIPSNAQPSGELKHGPLAMIDERCLSVVLLPYGDDHFERNVTSLKEIQARKGPTLVITTDDIPSSEFTSDWIVKVPTCDPSLLPILTIIPLQLLAYHWAVALGHDPDKPRNLAKSVTVG